MIYESSLISATNTDVLAGGRLNSIPYNGQLTLDFLADLGDVTNNYVLTLQLPNGDVPIDGQVVPASGAGVDMLLDDRELLRVTFPAFSGGHFVVSLTESGTATCAFRAILRP
jgi:hypothetical protein